MAASNAKPLTEAEKKAIFAAKYKELTLNLQKFFDDLPDGLYDTSACEALVNMQTECADAYEELTGKTVF